MVEIRWIENMRDGVFEAWSNGTQVGEMTYLLQGEHMTIDHTEVYEGYEGKGIARQMILAAVDFARANGRKIVPVCSYARAVLTRTDEYADVVA